LPRPYFNMLVCHIILFHILLFILVPGGSIAQDGDKPCKTNACVFEAPEDMDSMHNYEQVCVCVCYIFLVCVLFILYHYHMTVLS
jgi:predicted secreted protein